jgi:hypothetical protein
VSTRPAWLGRQQPESGAGQGNQGVDAAEREAVTQMLDEHTPPKKKDGRDSSLPSSITRVTSVLLHLHELPVPYLPDHVGRHQHVTFLIELDRSQGGVPLGLPDMLGDLRAIGGLGRDNGVKQDVACLSLCTVYWDA